MKIRLLLLTLLFVPVVFGQRSSERIPSYFGLQVRPVFPTAFIGSNQTDLLKDGFETTVTQRLGYSFGGTVRVGLTKLIALETGINFTQRQFNIDFAVPDSNAYGNDLLTFIEYDVPLNALMYIRLADKWYMNASLGFSLTYRPTHVGTYNPTPGGHIFTHTGLAKKGGFGINANVGFEYRTDKKGFFYIGGSARALFAPLFSMVADYQWEGNLTRTIGDVDGSFLAIDFKYFFPNIKNKGPQFNDGPIQ